MTIIFFDIDDTLMTTTGASKRAMNAAFLELLGKPLDLTGLNLGGRTDAGIICELAKKLGFEITTNQRNDVLASYLQHLSTELQTSGGGLLPGAAEILAIFQAEPSVELGIITGNSKRGADLKLDRHGVGSYFQFGGYGDAHEHRDDVARDGLAAARRTIGDSLDSRDIWVIGDTPHDVTCATAIGARCIAVTSGMFSDKDLAAYAPHAIVKDLFAVHDIVFSAR